MAKSTYRDIIKDTLQLDEHEYVDLCNGKPVLIVTGTNLMGQKIFTEIMPPYGKVRKQQPPAEERKP